MPAARARRAAHAAQHPSLGSLAARGATGRRHSLQRHLAPLLVGARMAGLPRPVGNGMGNGKCAWGRPEPPLLCFPMWTREGRGGHNSKPGRFAPVLRGSNHSTGGFKTKKKERKKEEAQGKREGEGRRMFCARTALGVVPARTEIGPFFSHSRWEMQLGGRSDHKAAAQSRRGGGNRQKSK